MSAGAFLNLEPLNDALTGPMREVVEADASFRYCLSIPFRVRLQAPPFREMVRRMFEIAYLETLRAPGRDLRAVPLLFESSELAPPPIVRLADVSTRSDFSREAAHEPGLAAALRRFVDAARIRPGLTQLEPPHLVVAYDPDVEGPPLIRLLYAVPPGTPREERFALWDSLSALLAEIVPDWALRRRLSVAVRPTWERGAPGAGSETEP